MLAMYQHIFIIFGLFTTISSKFQFTVDGGNAREVPEDSVILLEDGSVKTYAINVELESDGASNQDSNTLPIALEYTHEQVLVLQYLRNPPPNRIVAKSEMNKFALVGSDLEDAPRMAAQLEARKKMWATTESLPVAVAHSAQTQLPPVVSSTQRQRINIAIVDTTASQATQQTRGIVLTGKTWKQREYLTVNTNEIGKNITEIHPERTLAYSNYIILKSRTFTYTRGEPVPTFKLFRTKV